MTKANILYVEDDQSLSFVTKDHLEINGFSIVHCANGHQAKKVIDDGLDDFDCCLLDVMLPGIDGFQLAELIRKKDRDLPVLFLTAKSLKEDRIHGLKLGADDYIVKPFSIEELILKIEVFLRRNRIRPAHEMEAIGFDIGKIGTFTFEASNLHLCHQPSGAVRRLTRRESDLLRYLSEHRNKVIERGTILKKIWGKDDYFLGRSLDVFISRLRKYLSADPSLEIENVHGVGFFFKVETAH